MSTEFEREERYIVFKLSDLGNSLKGDEIRRLAREYAEQRRLRGKPPLECAVVESDWPEYEPTWRAIEARVAGERLAPSMPSPDIYVSDTGHAWDAKLNPELRHSPNATPYWAQPSPSFADAYQGAMEDVAIWKKRALEAEDLNRKFVTEINGPAYTCEPVQPAASVPVEAIGKMLADAMAVAVSNGANSISMPDEYVEVAVWLRGISPQPSPSVPEDFSREELEAVAAGLDTYEKTVNVGNVTGEGDDHLESTTAYAARFIRAMIAIAPEAKS